MLKEESHSANSDNIKTVIFLKDLSGRYLYVNRGFEKLLSLSSEEVKGKTDYDFLSHDIADPIVRNDQIVAQSGLPLELEERVSHGDVLRTYKTVKIPVPDTSGKVFAVCGIAMDISEQKKVETNLHIANTIFESKVGIMVTDANSMILRVNRSFVEMTGYSEEELIGHSPKLLQSGQHDEKFYINMWERINRTGEWQGEIWDKRKNGELYPKWLSIAAVKDSQCKVTHYVGMHYDISERKKSEDKIEELAYFDQLTHLPNRTLLRDRLKQATIESNRDNIFGALLLIDLDHFKTLNDTMGHDKGDLLLQLVAQLLTNCVREGDTIARLGGDEFVVVLKGLSEDSVEAANQTETVGTKILVALNQIYQLGCINHRCTASIGATLFNGDKVSIDDLFKQAELAMYKAKDAGRNALRFFDSNMEIAVMKRASLEHDLHEAVRDNQFLLHYQAKITDQKLIGSEVLVRWQHPQRGLVSPDEFIPLAEETGLILPLGRWVLETACTQLAIWSAQPEMAHLSIAVNVSARQFHQHDFVNQVIAVIKETGANPHNLKLELTESMLAYDIEDVIEKMYSLKAKGIMFSLDDFGTGFSSLSYLKRLPLDQLKIDKSFVQDVLVDTNDAAIAKTIIALAESLGLGVIAEGVETEAQRDFLANSGCHSYQGYFFSRPLPLAEFEKFARQF